MNQQSYLTFRLREAQYALEVTCVREIFPLPALIPAPEAPGDIIGLLNLRGQVVPIMHLDRRLGQPMPPCQASDSVILMDWQGLQVGMVVHQVEEVVEFNADHLTAEVSYGRQSSVPSAFLKGIAQAEDSSLIFLLNSETLIRWADEVVAFTAEAAEGSSTKMGDFYSLYCPHITPTERNLLARRAAELRTPLDADQADNLTALAVIGIEGQYFGLPLEAIREFIRVQKVSPIPCCPSHIVGNINLRGEVMTLVDIRATLNLPTPPKPLQQAVIVEGDDLVAGITVDEVRDILFIPSTGMLPLPIALRGQSTSALQGLVPYGDHKLGILKVAKLLTPEPLAMPLVPSA